MAAGEADLTRRRGHYGIDAPYVPIMLGAGGLVLAFIGVRAARTSAASATLPFVGAAFLWLSTASYLYCTRRGKHAVWASLLSELHLRGDEQVLDLGCGRGAVLLAAAKLVPRGRAAGLDLWRSSDQSGNSMDTTRRNAELEGVPDRVALHTGDMTAVPFADASFDVVLSSVAMHNIPDRDGRRKAVDQAVRVLRPGGQIVVADIRASEEYRDRLRELGMADVTHRSLGWRFWYGGPWMATKVVTARKPA